MDIRSVQKTGDMKYVYLPTKWCKEQNIGPNSKVVLEQKDDGSLVVVPGLREKKKVRISLSIDETDFDIIQKLIVACYINPADAFTIGLKNTIDPVKLLDKGLVALEMVEVDKNKVVCESSIAVSDPESLLRTSIRKIKNVIVVMLTNYHEKLVERYEEEIDRNKLLISKAVIGALTYRLPIHLKTIDLYYIGLISTYLEGMADHLITIERSEKEFLEMVLAAMDELQKIFENLEGLSHQKAIDFLNSANKIKTPLVKDIPTYRKRRIKKYLINVGEVVLDWAVTKEIEK